jgi:CDP-glycerol glycerophosphotransferase (TagB/SpsB family)
MEALGKEEVALVYGPRMIDFMKEKGVFNNLKAHVVTGNYRHQFYLEHQAFYDQLVANEILRRLPPAEKTLLYAPTWQDREKSSSFYAALPFLIKTLPESWNLIVKPHPNLRLQDEFSFERLLESYRDHPRVLFLDDFPPIYPLLNAVDIYIGDYSSIGYDFLTFQRPLFFLNQREQDPEKDPGLYLYRCGTCIAPSDYPQIYQKIADFESFELRDFAKIQAQVYDQTFGPSKNLAQLREEIKQSYAAFPEADWNFF